MRIMNSRPWYVDYLFIFMGTGIMALAIQCIFEPIGLVTGGFSGIAIIIRKMTAGIVEGGVPLWLTNLALNVPVFIAALIIKGRKFLGRTVIGTVLLSFWLYVIPQVDLTQGDYMLSAVFGGVITGMNRICVAGKGNDRWNRYGVSTDPEICASLFRGTDLAGH